MQNKELQDKNPDTKSKIFETAIRLFAVKGFNATGMRELAREAGVNLAMINYFYGTKLDLLESILDDFFTGLYKVMAENLTGDDPPEVKIRRHVKAVAGYVGQKSDQALIVISQAPLDDPKTTGLKAERAIKLIELMQNLVLDDLGKQLGLELPVHILGPAVISMIISHYVILPVLNNWIVSILDRIFMKNTPRSSLNWCCMAPWASAIFPSP